MSSSDEFGPRYLAAAVWLFLHPYPHPPSASSPALWSASLRRSLQPPSCFSWLGPLCSKAKNNGSRSKVTSCYLTSAGNYAADYVSIACSKHWRVFEHFLDLGKDFGHPLPTWPGVANGAQGQRRFRDERRCEEKQTHISKGMIQPLGGLCCAQRKMSFGSSSYLPVLFLDAFKRGAWRTQWFGSLVGYRVISRCVLQPLHFPQTAVDVILRRACLTLWYVYAQ